MCCFLPISTKLLPFFKKTNSNKRDFCNSCNHVSLDISQPGLSWVYVWSGLGSGKRLDRVSCIAAKCNTAQKRLSTPTPANLVPPVPSGTFHLAHLISTTSPLCKQTKTGSVIERMNDTTPVTFPDGKASVMLRPARISPWKRVFFPPRSLLRRGRDWVDLAPPALHSRVFGDLEHSLRLTPSQETTPWAKV